MTCHTQPSKATVLIANPNCLKCHAKVTARRGRDNHFAFLARRQANDPQAGRCVSCHSAHTTDGNAQAGSPNTLRARTICGACHHVLGEDEGEEGEEASMRAGR